MKITHHTHVQGLLEEVLVELLELRPRQGEREIDAIVEGLHSDRCLRHGDAESPCLPNSIFTPNRRNKRSVTEKLRGIVLFTE